jgi:hypothetical protein
MRGVILRAPYAVLVVCGLLIGCTPQGENHEINVTFDGDSCRARGPEIFDAGKLMVDLEKQAEGVVVVDLYRIDEGKTWPDLVSHYGPAGTFSLPPDWVTGVSGRDVRGDLYDRLYSLEPGNYGIVCIYMGSDTNGTWPAALIEVRSGSSG